MNDMQEWEKNLGKKIYYNQKVKSKIKRIQNSIFGSNPVKKQEKVQVIEEHPVINKEKNPQHIQTLNKYLNDN